VLSSSPSTPFGHVPALVAGLTLTTNGLSGI
jgi:hypothetical protein